MSYVPKAIKLDGSTNRLAPTGGLVGAVDNKTLLVSFWIRMNGSDAVEDKIGVLHGPSITLQLIKTSLNRFQILASTNLDISSSNNSVVESDDWSHVMASVDLSDTGKRHLYINNASDLAQVTTYVDANIDWTVNGGLYIGSNQVGGGLLDADIAEFYLTNEFFDLSVAANRAKFIDSALRPVDLGEDGSNPTGTAPLVYLPGEPDIPATGAPSAPPNKLVNVGTGGKFIENGAPVLGVGPDAVTGPIALDFDGANDWLDTNADLIGLSDGKEGIFSAWVRLDGQDDTLFRLIFNNINRFRVNRLTTNKFQVAGSNAAAATILDFSTVETYEISSTWLHLLTSWDLANDASHFYVNDVADHAKTTRTNDDIDYTGANWAIGANTSGTANFDGAMAEVYFAAEFLDFSVEANRRKFIDASGDPVYLGATGQLPTGTAPLIYLPNRVLTAGINAGSGGNFTDTGTFTHTHGPVIRRRSGPF